MAYAESGVRYKIWMLLKNGTIWVQDYPEKVKSIIAPRLTCRVRADLILR